ncbi:MAG: hypothetical protein H8D33_02670 [Cryomorphaceae bacterium]|nr:hypothetical protein [Cryomorphaceae bacterium]
MKILQKIAWLTRKWNLSIRLLDLQLHDGDNSWGFHLLAIRYNYAAYSLLAFECRLPNGAEVKQFVVDRVDILFLRQPLNDWACDLEENNMWSGRTATRLEKIGIALVGTIFK